MDLFLFAIGYLGLTAFFIGILLFGESPVFRNTPIASLHWFVTQGIFDGLGWIVAKTCGARGARALDSVYLTCCERPNAALQVAYLAMVLGGYWLYWNNLFSLLPNPWADRDHILLGSASVAVSLGLFVFASASDPGTIRAGDADTLAAWHALYPLDNAIWPEKTCSTCGLSRPARSKHCRICNRCVARHDHHCAWINNCVGAANMRHFLAFLVANLAMCAYGAVLACVILGGEMEARGVWRLNLVNYATGRVVPMWRVPSKMLEWLIVLYPVGVAVGLFMGVATLLVAFFLSYQLYLLAVGRTQYEMFRWRDLHHQMLEEAEQQEEQRIAAEREAATREAEAAGKGGGGKQVGSSEKRGGWLSSLWGARRVRVELPKNIYHRGFWRNAAEVLAPEVYLEQEKKKARRAAARAAGAAGAVDAGGSGRREKQGGGGGVGAGGKAQRGSKKTQ
ncbi:hypothetical protein CHLRE_02g090100v5 [Chlamydomonas reinhardtii]|uniref:S-acyltransferase n=1 Tax=Chlamydomonas reinhardtii TaxID=3055 RepID=A0A2K3E164_CHLRE|nr:uncharacterized protein CHLRE_02g090100v5 [Chlamydomonas reinhardtii]PNW86524.1 hypothetical protein CHLRE_02g090100v5 [Chlamydomonas reinhardtii]